MSPTFLTFVVIFVAGCVGTVVAQALKIRSMRNRVWAEAEGQLLTEQTQGRMEVGTSKGE